MPQPLETTRSGLRDLRGALRMRHQITVDGDRVPVSEVETGLLKLVLPRNNILGTTARTAQSVAHGWVALLNRLTPGRHEIQIHVKGTDVFDNPIDFVNMTTIVVEPKG